MSLRAWTLLLLALCAGGCASGDSGGILETMQAAVGRKGAQLEPKLDPSLRYLRITIAGRAAYLALGYYDEHPQGTIEVWYSAEREVIRLQNGRVVGVSGFSTEWRNVVLQNLPSWSELAGSQTTEWVRTRDVMPGYRYSVRDALALARIAPPKASALRGLDGGELVWFEERYAGGKDARNLLPPARYAVQIAGGRETVVYGEQCIAPQTCFTWQRWPAGN